MSKATPLACNHIGEFGGMFGCVCSFKVSCSCHLCNDHTDTSVL